MNSKLSFVGYWNRLSIRTSYFGGYFLGNAVLSSCQHGRGSKSFPGIFIVFFFCCWNLYCIKIQQFPPKSQTSMFFKFRLSVKTSSSLFWNSSPRDMVKAMNQDGGIFWPSLSVWLWCVLVSWFQNRRIQVLWTDKKRDNSYMIFFCFYKVGSFT